jgi:hypothetical protein
MERNSFSSCKYQGFFHPASLLAKSVDDESVGADVDEMAGRKSQERSRYTNC